MVEREVWVTPTKASNEVVFEGLDGAFCRIAAMDVGRGELVVNVFSLEVLFQGIGTLIVKSLEAGTAAGTDESVVELGVASLNDLSFATGKGLNSNVVAVVVIEDEQVVVAFAGGQREAASEITIAATSGRAVKHGSKEEMGPGAVVKGRRKKIRLRKKGQ